MSNLRWILLFAGIAILLFLYFSGRPRKVQRATPASRGDFGDVPAHDVADPLMDQSGPGQQNMRGPHGMEDFDPAEFDAADFERPDRSYVTAHPVQGGQYSGRAEQAYAHHPEAGGYAPGSHVPDRQAEYYPPSAVPPSPVPNAPQLRAVPTSYKEPEPNSSPQAEMTPPNSTSIGGKIDALFGRNKVANQAQIEDPERREPQKVILLHVVAPDGQLIDGDLLLQVFEHRRYHFGEKNIFHSMHNGETVFSIAKMIEPGSFDVNDITSFETPGLVLIMQLPGPVAGDVAFEVLISEAHELADALGCRVLDSKRSTLSRQTTQHLRENIRNYMHRQKYFNKAVS